MNALLMLALSAINHSSVSKQPDVFSSLALHQDPGAAKQVEKKDEKKQEEKKDPFQDAIKDMTKKDGMFRVYQKDDSYYFEIPKELIGRDFLWTTELKETPTGLFSGTFTANGVVRFETRGEKLYMRSIDYSVRATEGKEIGLGVQQSTVNPIIKSFTIKARSPEGNILVDVGSYFKNDIQEFSAKGALGGAMVDGERSYINTIKPFPQNINVEVTQTVTGGGGGRGGFGFGSAPARSSNTGVVLHSIVLLPEKPMKGRLKDSRIGYFSTGYTDYGTDDHGVKEYAFIDRYKLEKADPTAAVSEPKKPIVYYISREIPAKWREYVKKGIEDWQPAFEEAGFKHAIIAKDAPTKEQDPNWDPEDARYSVVRWAPLPIANAVGPHVSDPRSGEIISAHVIVWHDILKLQTEWYFAQAAATDKRAQRLPLPDDLMGECLRFVVAHEVGHTLGLPHNGKSSGTIPVKLLRDPKWTAENGTCTSIMDYARFNYVAQPGDGAALIPKIGRYDKYSIMWGYKPIEMANTPWDEKSTLDLWASRQVNDPMLRFHDNFDFDDPTSLMESLGDNTVEASTYGVANLKRIMGFLMTASTKFGEDYSDLARMYSALGQQFTMYAFHVRAALGGMIETDYHAGRGTEVYAPVPKDYQKSAAMWLCETILQTPSWFAPREMMLRIGKDSQGAIPGLQNFAISSLLDNGKWGRMAQNEALNGSSAYTVSQMLADVRGSVFKELYTGSAVSLNRRNVQRLYLRGLTQKLGASSENKLKAMKELREEEALFASAMTKTTDPITLVHLQDLKKSVEFAFANPDKITAPAANPFFMDSYQPWCQLGWKELDKLKKSFSKE